MGRNVSPSPRRPSGFSIKSHPDSPPSTSPRPSEFSVRSTTGALSGVSASWSVAMSRSGRLFVSIDGTPHQVIAQYPDLSIATDDLTGFTPEHREAEVQRRAREDAKRPFDLTRGPLARVSLLRLDDAEHAVLLTMHHLITDGWSLGVAANELVMLYESDRRSCPVAMSRSHQSSMRTSPAGSATSLRVEDGTGRSIVGGTGSPACRLWSCQRTALVRRSGARGELCILWCSRQSSPRLSVLWPAARSAPHS